MADKTSIITIDGPSGSGKSTISRQVAARLDYTYLDTGAMYRAVGLKAQRHGVDLGDETALSLLLDDLDLRLAPGEEDTRVFLDQEEISAEIRTAAMGLVASRVSAVPVVRAKLTALQRQMAEQGSVVAEGRDTGTVVFPGAKHKFYLDATPEERAKRRRLQLLAKGQQVDHDILQQILKRDQDDSSRSLAPLKPAEDAVIIDSSTMPIEEVVGFVLSQINRPNDT